MSLLEMCDRFDIALAGWDRAVAAYRRGNIDKITLIQEDNRTMIKILGTLIEGGFESWHDFFAFYLLTSTDSDLLDSWAMARAARIARIVAEVDDRFDYLLPDERTVA